MSAIQFGLTIQAAHCTAGRIPGQWSGREVGSVAGVCGVEAGRRGVVIQIISCDPDHIVPGAQPVHFSSTFVSAQGSAADRRYLSRCPGSP